MAAVAMAHAVPVRFDFYEVAKRFQLLHHRLSALVAVHTAILARKRVHSAVLVHHFDYGEVVPKAHFKVVGVVRGGNFNAARAVLHIGVLVGNDGYGLVYYGQNYVFADIIFIPFVGGVYCHGGVAEHSFGTGGGNYQPLGVGAFEEVFEVPEMRIFVGVFHLRVRERRLALGAPVDNSVAVVNKALVIEVDEHLPHRARALFVHSEGKARPVARTAQRFELGYYSAAVLFFPVPRQLQKLFARQIGLVYALLFELFNNLYFGCDRGVVGTGKPEGAIPLHSFEPDERILIGFVERVPHMKLARYVGRGHHYSERNLIVVPLRAEAPFLFPFLINLTLKRFGAVRFFHKYLFK